MPTPEARERKYSEAEAWAMVDYCIRNPHFVADQDGPKQCVWDGDPWPCIHEERNANLMVNVEIWRDYYRTAVRAALVAEMVAGVEEAIRKLPEPNLSEDDKVRYAFAGKMAAFAIVLDNLRPTETDNGKL